MRVGTQLNRQQILDILPHRDPFFFLDSVESIQAGMQEHLQGNDAIVGRKITAWMKLTGQEGFFKGHFPGNPIMPGVLMVEAMAQAAALLAYLPELHGPKLEVLLVSTERARFRKPVLPGCRVKIEATLNSIRSKFFNFDCVCTVDGQKVAEATLTASFGPGSGRA